MVKGPSPGFKEVELSGGSLVSATRSVGGI